MKRPLAILTLMALGLPPVGASAKDCRAVEAPPGVRTPDRPGCNTPSTRSTAARPPSSKGRDDGFIDLGTGTQVKISGRVRMEAVRGR